MLVFSWCERKVFFLLNGSEKDLIIRIITELIRKRRLIFSCLLCSFGSGLQLGGATYCVKYSNSIIQFIGFFFRIYPINVKTGQALSVTFLDWHIEHWRSCRSVKTSQRFIFVMYIGLCRDDCNRCNTTSQKCANERLNLAVSYSFRLYMRIVKQFATI